ncbi:MAG: RDD family protein [Candidatus Heimdallarchaeota archaeon]|nr:MAG: RDD family protein [Candidatus Heimdallarchaeota archaeon]
MASAIKLIAGFFIIMIGFPIFIGGSAILLIVPLFTDDHGYFMSNRINIAEDGYAAIRIDIPLEDVEMGVRIDPSRFITLKMEVHGESPDEKVFVGLTTTAEVGNVLTSNVSYVQIENFEYYSGWETDGETQFEMKLNFIENLSTRDLPQINAVDWIADTGITGNEFIWAPSYLDITSGDLSLVLINEDPAGDHGAENNVNITFSVGAKIPIINAIGWVLVVFGGLITLLGIILVWSGIRTKKPRTERVRYYQGAPATRVEPVIRPSPKFNLQCSNCGSLNEPDSTFCSQCGEILLPEDRKTMDEAVQKAEVEVFEPTGAKLVVAEGWPRFWAWLIDIMIVGAVTSIISSMVFFAFEDWTLWEFGFWSPFQWLFSLGPSSLFFFLYCVVMEYYYGQTLGKMVLNIEVVSGRDGSRPLLSELIISAIGKSFFLPLDVFLGWITRDETQVPNLEQRLTQKWARTVVIQQEKEKDKSPLFISGRV